MNPANPQSMDFQQYLQTLAGLADAQAGFFGPRSMVWRISREPVLLLFGMRALLLQIAHPVVAQGVADHSNYRHNPLGRGIRTFQAVHAMVFGSRDTALEAALMVHKVHSRVHGRLADPLPPGFDREYSAGDPQALLWVAATLLDSSILAYERCIEPLSEADKERFYQEGKRFGQLFGVPLQLYPATWADFITWMANTIASDKIVVTATAKDILHGLLFGTWFTRIIAPINYAIAAMTLPHKLRLQFGLKQPLWVRATYKATLIFTSLFMRSIPRRIRAVPAARHAERRLNHPITR